jgi:L-asparaginase
MAAKALNKPALLVFVCLLTSLGHAQTKPVVVLIATGGTISMEIDPIKHGPAPKISGEALLALVPAVTNYATVEVTNFTKMPSDYMDPILWTQKLCRLVFGVALGQAATVPPGGLAGQPFESLGGFLVSTPP